MLTCRPLSGRAVYTRQALARSLAALRRSALYGSRTDTQRLGTVKVWRSFFTIWSGYFSASRRSFSSRRGSWE